MNGYLEHQQRPEYVMHFFPDVVGIPCIEPAVLEQRTNAYKAWVRQFNDERGIPVPQARPKGYPKKTSSNPTTAT